MQRRAPRSKLLIARRNQRSAKGRKFRVTGPVVGEKRLNRRAVGNFDGVFRVADDFFEAAKEKNLYARCL